MLNNIKRGEMKEVVEYSLNFYVDRDGGYGFPCDENGNVFESNPALVANYKRCLERPEDFPYAFNQLEKRTHRYREPDTGVCSHCGTEVMIQNEYMGAFECPGCGQWYNLFGQELKNPHRWHELEDW